MQQMNDQERDLITQFVSRVAGAPQPSSVPATVPATIQPLPPIDPDADRLISDLFARYPEARYRITQMAFVQEHAVMEAQNQINRLQWELQQAKAAAAPPAVQAPSPWGAAAQAAPQAAPQPAPSRGMFGGLFGGGQQAAPPPQYQQPQYAPPPPQYAPGYQPGMFQRQGSGFLGSALTTAAGVAGGVVAGNALMNMFSGHSGFGGGGFGGGGFGGNPTEVEYVPAPPADDPYDVGGAAKDATDSGWQDSSAPAADPGGWTDTSGSDSGWTDNSGSDSGWTDVDNT
jgi:hypothetical protein